MVDGGARGVGDIAGGFDVGAWVEATASHAGVAIAVGSGSLGFDSDSVAFEKSGRLCGTASPTTRSNNTKRRNQKKAAVYIFRT